MRRFLLLTYLFLIFVFLSASAQHHPKKYYCPPCNCRNDGLIFDKPGVCTDTLCRMELLPVEGPYQESKLKIWTKLLRKDWLGFYDTLILPAIIQGIILSLLLLFRKNENKLPARFLATLVVGLSVQNIKFFYLANVLNNYISTIGGNPEYAIQSLSFPLTGILFIGPALYFYVRSLTISEFRFNYRHALHFLPGIAFIVIYSLAFSGIANSENPPVHRFVISLYSTISTAENLLAISLSFYYILLSVKLIGNHEVWVYQHFSTTSRKSLRWLRNLVISLSLVWIIWFFAVVINFFTRDFILTYLGYYPFQIATSIIIFWIGYVGFIQGEIFSMEVSFEQKINSLKPNVKKEPETNYEVKKALLKAMESDKLFLTPELSLAMLAHQLNITPKNISQALNNDLNKNFHDFINEYRVEEVKKRLINRAYNHLTILSIAMDSGFNSKSSFNRIFMKATGMSPKEFREKQKHQI